MNNRTTVHADPFLRIACISFLCLALLFTAAILGNRDFARALALIICSTMLWLVWMTLNKANHWTKRRDFLNPAVGFILAYLAWFSLGSADVLGLSGPAADGMFSSIPLSQWGFYLLGLAGYCLGLQLGKTRRRIDSNELRFRNEWNPTRFRRLVILLSLIMLLSGAIQVYQFGVPGLSRTAGEDRLAIRGIAHFFFISCSFTVLIVIPAFAWTRETTRRAKILAALVVFSIVIALPLLQGGRSDLVVSLLTVFVIFHYLKKRSTLFSLMALAVVVILLLSLAGYLRDYSLASGGGMDWLNDLGIPAWLVPVTYALLYVRYTVATLRDITGIIPDRVPFQHGALTLAPLKTFLPGHHEMSDMFFKNILGSDFVGGGQPATLLGPLYGDFGRLGIFVGMLGFGLIAIRAHGRMQRRPTLINVIIYAWILQTGLMGLFGSLFTYINAVTMPICWIAFDWLAKGPNNAKTIGVGNPSLTT
jgi:oligosaccharide repeat unit polymerase